MKRFGVVVILLLAFAGIADAAYIAQSVYARFLGVPLAEYEILFYGALFVLAALELVLYDRTLRRTLQGLALLGLLVSVGCALSQLSGVSDFLIYSTASAVISLLILL